MLPDGASAQTRWRAATLGDNELWVGAEMPYSHSSMAYRNAGASRPAGSPAASCAAMGRAQWRPSCPSLVGLDRAADLRRSARRHGSPTCRTGLHQDCSQCLTVALADERYADRSPVVRCPFVVRCPLLHCGLRHAVHSSAARCPLQRCAVNVVRWTPPAASGALDAGRRMVSASRCIAAALNTLCVYVAMSI